MNASIITTVASLKNNIYYFYGKIIFSPLTRLCLYFLLSYYFLSIVLLSCFYIPLNTNIFLKFVLFINIAPALLISLMASICYTDIEPRKKVMLKLFLFLTFISLTCYYIINYFYYPFLYAFSAVINHFN